MDDNFIDIAYDIAKKPYKTIMPSKKNIEIESEWDRNIFLKNIYNSVLYQSYRSVYYNNLPFVYDRTERKQLRVIVDSIIRCYQKKYGTCNIKQRGAKRNVNEHNTFYISKKEKPDVYIFDKLYAEKELNDVLYNGEKPLAEYVLHMSVAFMLSPLVIDEILSSYGYLPLHVKNIHHLSIIAVLNESVNKQCIENVFNPFEAIKQLYMCAKQILNNKNITISDLNISPTQSEFAAFANNETVKIEEFFAKKGISSDTMINYIVNHQEVYNFRHSKILQEHEKLSIKYINIYNDNNEYADSIDGIGNNIFCLRQFINRFSKPMAVKHWKDNLINYVKDYSKHPTREIMIIMWLYENCIYKNDNAGCVWNGSNMVFDINKKLLSLTWGVLNEKYIFDYYIKKLECFKINKVNNEIFVVHNDKRISDFITNISLYNGIPIPLLFVRQYFEKIREVRIIEARKKVIDDNEHIQPYFKSIFKNNYDTKEIENKKTNMIHNIEILIDSLIILKIELKKINKKIKALENNNTINGTEINEHLIKIKSLELEKEREIENKERKIKEELKTNIKSEIEIRKQEKLQSQYGELFYMYTSSIKPETKNIMDNIKFDSETVNGILFNEQMLYPLQCDLYEQL